MSRREAMMGVRNKKQLLGQSLERLVERLGDITQPTMQRST